MLWLAPCAAIARGVLLSIWLKKLSILRKINFFIKKKWKKFGSIKKKAVSLHCQTNKNNYNNEKEKHF